MQEFIWICLWPFSDGMLLGYVGVTLVVITSQNVDEK